MITSFIDGRVRIRDNELTKGPVAAAVERELLATAGVDGATANRQAGSLLVTYDPSVITIDRLMEIIAPALAAQRPAPESSRASALPAAAPKGPARTGPVPAAKRKRQAVKIGMLVSLAASLLSAALDLKKLHIALGLVFLTFLGGGHLYEKRKLLFV